MYAVSDEETGDVEVQHATSGDENDKEEILRETEAQSDKTTPSHDVDIADSDSHVGLQVVTLDAMLTDNHT